jgi:histidyl-tRNA synthetase
MPAPARELMKEHPMSALNYLTEQQHELAFRSPNTLEYLSDQSRKHFREIIEYLDMSETPYEIDPHMLGHHECYSDALFSLDISLEDPETEAPVVVRGGRFDEFVHRTTRTKTSNSWCGRRTQEQSRTHRDNRDPKRSSAVSICEFSSVLVQRSEVYSS